jgi:ATP-dependent DNA ligase
MAAVSPPVPLALARLTDTLTPIGVKSPLWEPKWDGYRAMTVGGHIWSRNGTNLTPMFPDLAPILAARLPAGVLLDGELVAWDTYAGRLDFASLQARMTAGRRIRSVAEQRPAQFVAFDMLGDGDADLRSKPLHERRKMLERALLGCTSPIVLCQQTDDLATAREWLRTLTAGGIEGVVIKDAAGTYPTKDRQRIWWKVKAKAALDMLAIGYTGAATAPTTLVLAFPGVVDDAGQPVTAGSTTVLNKAVSGSLAPLLRPTGDTFVRAFAWGSSGTSVTVIEPFVVEVQADASAEAGVLRHAAKLVRPRPDLDPAEAS